MVRRTRACAPCRKRRMKCDETFPHCLQCTKFNRSCPGPQQGPKIVDLSAETAARAQNIRAPGRKQSVAPQRSRSDHDLQVRQIIVTDLDHTPVFLDGFLSKFVSYFTSNGSAAPQRSWMFELHSVNYDRSGILSLSMSATASAYCALETSNQGLLGRARSLYGEALQRLALSVEGLGRARNLQSAPIHTISGIILLSFYEAMLCTLPAGYCGHIGGAAKMLELVGPEQCSHGLMNQLFFTMRTQMILVSTLTRQKSIFATEPYLDIPYMGAAQPLYEKLTTLITILTEVYNNHHIDIKTKINGFHIDPSNANSASIILDSLWGEFEEDSRFQEKPIAVMETGEGRFVYRDTFTAYMVSYFDSARLLLSVICERLHSLAVPQDVMESLCTSILSCTTFLSVESPGCAFLRAVLPLLLVAKHGPSETHRAQARGYFERWSKEGKISGLCKLALETLEEPFGDNGVEFV